MISLMFKICLCYSRFCVCSFRFVKFFYTKKTNSFQSSMSHHQAVMDDFMNRKQK